jgi:Transglycosylase SLT domain
MAAKALPVEKQVLKVIRRRSAAGGRGGPLRDHDDEARARLGNYAESKFGRVVSASSAGAQGPMQFIPSTWAAYGLGGDVHDPHDAILGAANYLHASGAPADYRVALYHYNPVPEYVDAVMRYAPSDDPRPQDVLCVLQLAGLRADQARRSPPHRSRPLNVADPAQGPIDPLDGTRSKVLIRFIPHHPTAQRDGSGVPPSQIIYVVS